MLQHSGMCSFHSRGSHKLPLTSTTLGYFVSSPLLPLPILSWQRLQHKHLSAVPRTLTLLKLDLKSELPGKQANKQSIFSQAAALYSPSKFLSTHSASFLPTPNFSQQSRPPSNKSVASLKKPGSDASWETPHRQRRQDAASDAAGG